MKRRKLDKVFFLLYNYYYKDGNYKEGKFEKFVPWHYTIFILNLGSILWTILIMSIGIYYLFHMFVNKSYAHIFYAFPLFIFLFIIHTSSITDDIRKFMMNLKTMLKTARAKVF
jgi:hypothetical protein